MFLFFGLVWTAGTQVLVALVLFAVWSRRSCGVRPAARGRVASARSAGEDGGLDETTTRRTLRTATGRPDFLRLSHRGPLSARSDLQPSSTTGWAGWSPLFGVSSPAMRKAIAPNMAGTPINSSSVIVIVHFPFGQATES